jgi:hypothetical protein
MADAPASRSASKSCGGITPPTTIRLAVMGYSAFTAERYASATAVMVGTGLTAPSF